MTMWWFCESWSYPYISDNNYLESSPSLVCVYREAVVRLHRQEFSAECSDYATNSAVPRVSDDRSPTWPLGVAGAPPVVTLSGPAVRTERRRREPSGGAIPAMIPQLFRSVSRMRHGLVAWG